jgi:hypothetical protein
MRHGWTIVPGLIVCALELGGFATPAVAGELTDDRLGNRTVPIFLLTRSDIQADLRLKPEQVVECTRAAVAFQRRAFRLVGRKDSAAVAARGEIDGELNQWLSNHLSSQQFGRLEQIDLQWEGASAMLSRPYIDEALALTPTQKKSVSDCIAQGKAKRARGAWTYEDHTNVTREALAVLTPTQRDLWVRLLGPQCKFVIAAAPPKAPGQPVARGNSQPASPLR